MEILRRVRETNITTNDKMKYHDENWIQYNDEKWNQILRLIRKSKITTNKVIKYYVE